MRRRIFATALSLSLCLSSGTAAPSAAGVHQGRQDANTLCRRAAALPSLPPEPAAQNERNARGGRAGAEPVPAPPPMPSVSEEEAAISVTGTRIRRPNLSSSTPVTIVGEVAADAAAPPPTGSEASPPSPPPPDRPAGFVDPYPPRSGMLTAGDHDDLLNPELYADYAGKFLQQQEQRERVGTMPFVDTRRVLTVAVQDRSGRPAPFARVTLTCADGNSLSLDTLADGTAVFFPEMDRLGSGVTLTVSLGGHAAGEPRRIAISSGAGAQRQTVTLDRAASPVTRFDLAIVLDTTGSMGDEINFLTSELRAIVGRLREAHPGLDIRLALVAYRDEGDLFVTRTYPFSASADEMQQRLAAQRGDGGGDYPEAMDQALARAVALDWRPNSVRSLLLVADAPPHDENVAKTWTVAEAARARRIQITPVAASGVADLAEYVMRAMAAATQSRYLFLTDDSGIGNPHAPPAVDCYLVTKLETLIRRVLDSHISGRRVEPPQSEIIRGVGRYENGRCILPPDFAVQEIEKRRN